MSHTNALEQLATPDANTGPSTTRGNNPTPTPKQIQLSDGYSVTPKFFDEIRLHIEGRLPGLQHGRLYTSKALTGKSYWDRQGSGVQRLTGRCIAYMAVHHMLPLTFVKGKHEYPLRYQLT